MAGINLVIALPLILAAERSEAIYVDSKAIYVPNSTIEINSPELSGKSSDAKDKGPSFDLCGMLTEPSTEERVLNGADLPAVTFSGWRFVCPSRWTLSGMLHIDGWTHSRESLTAQKKVDAGLVLLIAIQWYFIGAFPMKGPKSWREPGMFITICSAIAFVLALIPKVEGLAEFPACLALMAWLFLFVFAVWRAIRFGWTRIVRSPATNAV